MIPVRFDDRAVTSALDINQSSHKRRREDARFGIRASIQRIQDKSAIKGHTVRSMIPEILFSIYIQSTAQKTERNTLRIALQIHDHLAMTWKPDYCTFIS